LTAPLLLRHSEPFRNDAGAPLLALFEKWVSAPLTPLTLLPTEIVTTICYHRWPDTYKLQMAFLTEADTCRRYVLPKLYAAGWTDDQISEQKSLQMAALWSRATR
jgi:hypothetical protein